MEECIVHGIWQRIIKRNISSNKNNNKIYHNKHVFCMNTNLFCCVVNLNKIKMRQYIKGQKKKKKQRKKKTSMSKRHGKNDSATMSSIL